MNDDQDLMAIQQRIARFASSFDLKDWDGLGQCLCDQLYTDYSDLRGTPPETISRETWLALRQSALQHLKTHHLSGNPDISVQGNLADASVSMVIFRKNNANETLHTHCLYRLKLLKDDGVWRISSIIQRVFWSDGQTAIHSGIQKT